MREGVAGGDAGNGEAGRGRLGVGEPAVGGRDLIAGRRAAIEDGGGGHGVSNVAGRVGEPHAEGQCALRQAGDIDAGHGLGGRGDRAGSGNRRAAAAAGHGVAVGRSARGHSAPAKVKPMVAAFVASTLGVIAVTGRRRLVERGGGRGPACRSAVLAERYAVGQGSVGQRREVDAGDGLAGCRRDRAGSGHRRAAAAAGDGVGEGGVERGAGDGEAG